MSEPRTYPSAIRWWPSAIGVVAGIAVGAGGGLAAVIMVCAAIYVLAAVTGRPNSAWIGFVASIPLIGIGIVLMQALSLAAIGVACVVLIVIVRAFPAGIQGGLRKVRSRVRRPVPSQRGEQ